MKHIFAGTLFCLMLSCSFLAAQEPYRAAVDRPVDVLHIRLDLDILLKQQAIAGTATIDFVPLRPVQSVAFDAVGHEIESVQRVAMEKSTQKPAAHKAASNGSTPKPHPEELSWENTGDKLLVYYPDGIAPGKTERIVITYRVREPKSGLYVLCAGEGSTQYDPHRPGTFVAGGD